jgi:poly(3-hydroxybutyrate) depolymerase
MHSQSTALLGLIAAAGLSAAQSAGCGNGTAEGGVRNVDVNGQPREYTLHIPENYDPSTPHRLIFGYHWLSGTMQNVVDMGYYGLEPLSEGSAIFVAPQGIDNGWANPNGDDITFTDMMVETLVNELCIDEEQIFATGFSYGAAMSYSVACSRPDVFRAVAPIAAGELSGCDGGTTPVAYLGMHGVSDSVLPIDGGRAIKDKFVELNGCQPQDAPEPAPGSGTHEKTEYACEPGYPVWWIAFDGDHVADPTDADGNYWAPGETWTFFTEAVNA